MIKILDFVQNLHDAFAVASPWLKYLENAKIKR